MDGGLIGGIVGGVLGLAGGIVGTYFSIRNTNGPRERAFMIKASIVTWIALAGFLLLLLLLPPPYNFLLWIPYGILLPLGIVKCNKRLAELRNQESRA